MNEHPFDDIWKQFCALRRARLDDCEAISSQTCERSILDAQVAFASASKQRQEDRMAWGFAALAMTASILVTFSFYSGFNVPKEPIAIDDVWTWEVTP